MKKIVGVLCLSLFLLGCSPKVSKDEYMQNVKELIIEQEFAKAEGYVELALENDKDNEEAKKYQEQLRHFINAISKKESSIEEAKEEFEKVIEIKGGSSQLVKYSKKHLADIIDKGKYTIKQGNVEDNKTKKKLWNEEKSTNLGTLMLQWGTSMGQVYKEYDLTQNLDYSGLLLPKDLISGEVKPIFDEKGIELSWEKNGQTMGEYTVVAFYSDFETQDIRDSPHSYLFVIHNEQAKVFITSQTQGTSDNSMYFNQTENPDLLSGFEQIYNETYIPKPAEEVSASQASTLDSESLRLLDFLAGTYYTTLEEKGGASFSIDKSYYTDLKTDQKYKITGATQNDSGTHPLFSITWDIEDFVERYGSVGPGPQAFIYELHMGIQGNGFALLIPGTDAGFTQNPGYLK